MLRCFLVLTVFVSCSCVPARASLIIGTIGSPRGGVFALVGGAYEYGGVVADYIVNNIPSVTFVGTQTLDAAFLSSIDVLIIDSAAGTGHVHLLPDEQTAVFAFVQSGKGAIIVADSDDPISASTFSSPFGIMVGSSADSHSLIVDSASPIANGPYGMPSLILTDPIGLPTSLADLGPYATAVARSGADGLGKPIIAAIAENVISPGSGRVVFFSDAGTAAGSARANDGVLLNAIAYVAVPEISTFAFTGSAFFSVVLVYRLIGGRRAV